MNKLRIGCDIDGVVACFDRGYQPIIERISGIKLPEIGPDYPDCWDWDKNAGVPNSAIRRAWDEIVESSSFWRNLAPYEETKDFLEFLSWQGLDTDVYFVTNRPGLTSKWQTEKWLTENGFTAPPTVLVSAEKGLVARALELTHYIDDKPSNCENVVDYYPACNTFLLDRSWNRDSSFDKRLTSIKDYMAIIDKDLDAQ